METPNTDDGLAAFVTARRRLFGIAYRMLGSAAEAEDIVQDVWLRWQSTDRSVVREPAAFLATTATRIAMNHAQSARARRETYVGPWLPEPIDTSADALLGAEKNEALGFAVLLLLEKLTPAERAAYVLREAFNYSYREIAEIIELTEENARQLVTRAKKHVTDGRRAQVSISEQKRLLGAFIAAAQKGDLAALEGLLASDVASYSDGGGRVRAAPIPVLGRARVSKFIAGFSSHFWISAKIDWIEANGQPAVLISRDQTIIALAAIDASADGIEQIMWMMNPDKLGAIAALCK